MSDEQDKPTLTRKPLGLKRTVEAGQVQQQFSHGRRNTVVVEVKRRRLIGRPGEAAPEVVVEAEPAPAPAPVAKPAPAPVAPAAPRVSEASSLQSRQERQAQLLREAEEARLTSGEDARRREEQERARQQEAERARAEQRSEAPAPAATPVAEVAAAEPVVADVADAAEPVAEERSATPAPAARRFTPVAAPKRPEPKPAKPQGDRKGAGDSRRQSGKLTVTRALNDDEGARARSLAALKRAREKEKRAHMGHSGPREKQVREVVVPDAITVAELANRMAEKGSDLVKALFKMGMPITINDTLDHDTAELLVTDFGHEVKRVSDADIDIDSGADVDAAETLAPRAPVVTIMGHVDHGKTSLLDALRGANVVSGEAGGITQHIGAYQVTTPEGALITFLDTPGHEAFTDMRARGANVTDIAILVVAADDGIKPQTIESINHAKAAGVPLIIAINKIDKDGANPQRVRERLLEHEIMVEAMGGEVQDVEVSALKKLNLDGLLGAIANQAEIMELKANPARAAEGTVIEAKLDKGRGPVATILIRRGTLKVGDIFVCGSESGRVRALVNDKGQQIKEAGPSTPVEVLGLGGVPRAGDTLTVVENEARAREVAAYRHETALRERTTQAPVSLEGMFSALADKAKVMEYPVVIRADVQGSTEAIVNALNRLSTDDIRVRVLASGVGAITEGDMTLAAATNAPIIGFNVRPNAKARALANRDRVRFLYYDVIYHLTEAVAKEMAGQLGPERIETVVGRAEVREVFTSGKRDKAAGLLVLEGSIKKGLFARLTREDVIVSATTIASLRRFKDNVDEVRAGMECGVVLADTNDIKAGDMLEVFEVEERERTL